MPVIWYSKKGGYPFEHIKTKYPDSLHALPTDIRKGLELKELLEIAKKMEISSV